MSPRNIGTYLSNYMASYPRGLATAQVVSRRLSTPAGICGGQGGTGAGFLKALRFPLPILILPTAARSLIVISFDAI
jgi:hypothetical protein